MKKLFHKLNNKIKNSGSGLILVIVALAFVGILTGALLTAVAYVYRLKLYDYNAKSNFYYLEQAMDEIYAGVGSQTMTEMQEAYQDTREKIIYYDVNTKSYKDIGNDAANKLFKDAFMSRIANQDYFKPVYVDGTTDYDYSKGIFKELQGMISNSSITLVKENLDVIYLNENGKPYNKADSSQVLAKVILKNVTLKREAEYDRSQAKGTFTQTISTDIEISRPDFDVNFNNNNLDIDNLFSFCMIADSGIEINESQGSKLTINGNIYGASDYYNKTYNEYDTLASNILDNGQRQFELNHVSDDGSTTKTEYNMNKVYNRTYGSEALTTLRNENYRVSNSSNPEDYLYNGYNERSKYSGLYIDGANVSILANYVIIPGSLSIMNAGDLTVYGRNESEITESNIWADEVVLAGYVPKSKNSAGSYTVAKGSNAFFNANLYVKDDTQIESDSAKLKLSGGYYGYSNSSTSDDRVFVPSTKKEEDTSRYIYQQLISGTNKVENRGHYNSSSIIVNSENATVDMSDLSTLYIAGRSYVELSHLSNGGKKSIQKNYKDDENVEYRVDESNSTYEYDTDVDDYRTGESISIKSTQLAYIPENSPRAVTSNGIVIDDPETSDLTVDHYECTIASVLGDSYLFQKYFGEGSKTVTVIPVIYTKDSVKKANSINPDDNIEKVMYYIDFDYVADHDLFDSSASSNLKAKTTANAGTYGDYLKQCFIKDYFDYINYQELYDSGLTASIPSDVDTDILDDDDLVGVLKDVTYYEDHLAGQISIPDLDANNVRSYSSGVITNTGEQLFKVNDKNEYKDEYNNTKKVTFNVVTAKNSVIDSTLEGSTTTSFNAGGTDNTTNFSKEYQKHYSYVKWALKDLEEGTDEADLVDLIVSKNGEGCLTPLNRYLNYDKIMDQDSLMIYPSTGTGTVTDISPDNLDLGDYKVYVSKDDISLECKPGDNNTITGIVISEGDVYFKTKEQIKADHEGWSDEQASKAVCNTFNGIIITGGKIYINNNVTSINSTDLCRNIINACMTKASLTGTNRGSDEDIAKARTEGACAIRFLSLFKAYENEASAALTKANAETQKLNSDEDEDEETTENEDSPLSISNIDYSDVIRYNNWMRNVD